MEKLIDNIVKYSDYIFQLIDKDPRTFESLVAMGVIAFALYVVMKIIQSLS